MPAPFPGMDPYLEGSLWTTFHFAFGAEIVRQPLPPAEYFIFLSRADDRPMTDVSPVALNQPLPSVPIPLLPGDPDTPLDLQQTFAAVYDLLGYNLAIDYAQPPGVPLARKAVLVAENILQAAGLRSA